MLSKTYKRYHKFPSLFQLSIEVWIIFGRIELRLKCSNLNVKFKPVIIIFGIRGCYSRFFLVLIHSIKIIVLKCSSLSSLMKKQWNLKNGFSLYLGYLRCGQMDSNASVPVAYTSPNMTIQFCVEVCKGANKPIAALNVIKFNSI